MSTWEVSDDSITFEYDNSSSRYTMPAEGVPAFFKHRVRMQIFGAFKLRPHQVGLGDMGCACHSAPFPAARDYRRRTKHRRRRTR